MVGQRRLRGPIRTGRGERQSALRSLLTRPTCGSTTSAPRWRSWSRMRGRHVVSQRSFSLISRRWQSSTGSRRCSRRCCRSNYRMIQVFRESGFPVKLRSAPEALEIELPTSLSAGALERFEERERIGAVAAVRSFLEPSSVAVIGASRRRGTIGGEILHNLLAAGFSGPVYAVNNKADVVQSLPAYRSVGDIPGGVELAVVALPSEQVVGAACECAAAGVRSLLVISSGFAETGAEGADRQHELLEVCRDAGIRSRRSQLPGRAQHVPAGAAERDVRAAAQPCRAGSGSCPRAEVSGSRSSRPRVASGSGCRRSSRSETSPIFRATTSSSTGSRTRTPSWRCSTSSRSATPGSSRASPAACRPPSRSLRSRADGPPRVPARLRRIPARCCRPRT